MSPSPRPSWKLLSSLLMLGLVPVAAGVVRLSGLAGGTNGGGVTSENARFMAMPAPAVVHIACASLFCVLGACQLDSALRQRFPRLHRMAGRVAAPCGIVAALTGLWMTAAYAIPAQLQGPLLYGVRKVVGFAMALAVIVSIRAVLQRRIAQHKAWMVRALCAGARRRYAGADSVAGDLDGWRADFIFRDVLMASAWGLNAVLAEWVIRVRLSST